MKIDSSFAVPLSPPATWDLLLDFERVGSAMPGATLASVDGDDITGSVVVRLGPMKIEYVGDASITTKDQANYRLVVQANGKEARGTGTAGATIEALLSPTSEGTLVSLAAEVDVTGRPAQMGAGLIEEVGQRLTDEFASRLRADLASHAAPDAGSAGSAPVGSRDDALDLGKVAGWPVLKRAALPILVLVGLGVIAWLLSKVMR